MSDIGYNRCPSDDWRAGSAQIGVNPETGQPIEVNVNGVAAAVAVQSALLTLTATMKAGHEVDFLEKVALTLFPKVQDDPHCLCPLLTLLSMLLLMVQGVAAITFDPEGNVVIRPPDMDIEPGETCMFEEFEDDGTDEGPVDRDGTEESGTGDGSDGGGIT